MDLLTLELETERKEVLNLSTNEFRVIGKNLSESEKLVKPSMTFWQDVIRRIRVNKVATISFWIVVLLGFMAIFGPMMSGYSYREQNLDNQFLWGADALAKGHFFGTDDFGRDLFTRVWEGTRVSLIIALVVVAIQGTFGAIYGGVAGFFGGKIDTIMMRIVEIIMAIPSTIYIILLMVVLGPGIKTIIIALAAVEWTAMALIVRGEVLRLKEQEYVMAAINLGASPMWIILKHLIPNAMGQIIVRVTMDIPRAIFAEAFLSFLGIGVPAPFASLGSLALDGYRMLSNGPHLFIIPGFFISLITLAFNLLGDGLRDALDPRLRK